MNKEATVPAVSRPRCVHGNDWDCCGPCLVTDGPHVVPTGAEPPAGSWASVARMMAADDDSGFDWDAWKDQMKEGNS